MNEILAYIGNNRRRVSVGYTLPDGKIVRVHRKIDGHDREAIQQAINDVKETGVEKIIIEVYRPNGSAEVICKTFTIPNDGVTTTPAKTSLGATQPLFPDQEMSVKKLPVKTPPVLRTQPQPSNTRSMEQSWKDYALKTEQEKVSKLEAEVKRLTIENRNFDTKVREFEKEMIKKDHELEKMQDKVENKSSSNNALNGIVEGFIAQPKETLMGFAEVVKAFKMNNNSGLALNAIEDSNVDPQTEQLVSNIRTWLAKQPMELQEHFYQMVFELTNSQNIPENINRIITLLKNK